MRANSWLYQFYSLHSKMHFGLAYDAHAAAAARLPTYYPNAPAGPAAIAYPAAPAPETPYHPAYHMHHAAMNPLSAPGGHAHHGANSAVLQYSPQAGSLPYPSLVPMNASPVAAAVEATDAHRQAALKRVPSPLDHTTTDETTSPEPSPKRANHADHYLPASHPGSYHHPRAAGLGYAASMFGSNAFYYSNLISYS